MSIKLSDPKVTKEAQDEEDRRFGEEVEKIIDGLVSSAENVHTFSSNLNARQRRIVHEMAEKRGVFHLSQGEEAKRFISISAKPIEPVERLDEGEKEKDDHELDEDVVEDKVELKQQSEVSVKNNFEALDDKTTNTSQSNSEKRCLSYILLFEIP